jgi:hypothetical protein
MFSVATCSSDETVRAGPRDLFIQQFRAKESYDSVFVSVEAGGLL